MTMEQSSRTADLQQCPDCGGPFRRMGITGPLGVNCTECTGCCVDRGASHGK